MKKFTFLFISQLISFFAIAEIPEEQAQSQVLPSIACLYKTTSHDHDSHHHDEHEAQTTESNWKLWRTDQQVEIQDTNSRQGEVWTRLKSDTLEYSWLDHKNKFRVNYPDSDLKATNSTQVWENKATLISPSLLLRLKKIETQQVLGYTAETYSGTVGTYQLEVTWLPELSIPAKITQQEGKVITTTELKEVFTYEKSPWKPIASDDYEDMDFADIGDNETHPIARSHLYGMGISAGEHKH